MYAPHRLSPCRHGASPQINDSISGDGSPLERGALRSANTNCVKFGTSGRSKPLGARWQWLWSNVCEELLAGDPSSTWPLSYPFPLYHYPFFPFFPLPLTQSHLPFISSPFSPLLSVFSSLIHYVPRLYDDPRARHANDCGRGVTVAEPRPRNEKGRWQCQCKSVIRKHPTMLNETVSNNENPTSARSKGDEYDERTRVAKTKDPMRR